MFHNLSTPWLTNLRVSSQNLHFLVRSLAIGYRADDVIGVAVGGYVDISGLDGDDRVAVDDFDGRSGHGERERHHLQPQRLVHSRMRLIGKRNCHATLAAECRRI